MNSLQLDFPKMTWGSGDVSSPLGTHRPPPPSGLATDRQRLAGVLARHVLHSHGEVAHGALAAAEVEAVWVHVQQVPAGAGERHRDRETGLLEWRDGPCGWGTEGRVRGVRHD